MKRSPTFLKILPALGLALGAAMLGGCAQPARQLQLDVAASHHWSGRMALQVQDARQQSFSAGFELQGQPEGWQNFQESRPALHGVTLWRLRVSSRVSLLLSAFMPWRQMSWARSCLPWAQRTSPRWAAISASWRVA